MRGSPKALKPGRSRYRFEQMADLVNDRVDDPAKAQVDRYVDRGTQSRHPPSACINPDRHPANAPARTRSKNTV